MESDINHINRFGVFLLACIVTLSTACSTRNSAPSPTHTIASLPRITPVPQYTNIPNHYDQNDNFGDGFIARVLIKDTNNLSHEDILATLVRILLEHYKTKSLESRAAIKDYKDVYVYKTINASNNTDDFFEIVASVKFSIIPAEIPNDWASFPGDINPNDPWWRLVAPFGVFKDGNDYRLRLVFGWGT